MAELNGLCLDVQAIDEEKKFGRAGGGCYGTSKKCLGTRCVSQPYNVTLVTHRCVSQPYNDTFVTQVCESTQQ